MAKHSKGDPTSTSIEKKSGYGIDVFADDPSLRIYVGNRTEQWMDAIHNSLFAGEGGDVKTDALRIALPALLAGATLAACAGLPTVSLDDAKAVAAQAALVGDAHGRLPGPGTERLLKKRWSSSTLDSKALAILEEAATGVPLIAGNKVELLLDGPVAMAEMAKSIAVARNSINFETYVFD